MTDDTYLQLETSYVHCHPSKHCHATASGQPHKSLKVEITNLAEKYFHC